MATLLYISRQEAAEYVVIPLPEGQERAGAFSWNLPPIRCTSFPQQLQCMHVQVDPVQAAADAAAEAVGGGVGGPAAVAARRAASNGLEASRQGFTALGGASEHMAALRELVALPLQARPAVPCTFLLIMPCSRCALSSSCSL